MPVCAFIGLDKQGAYDIRAVDPPPADLSTCPLVVPTYQEYLEASQNDWLNLTPEQGAQIGGAILLVWSIAWVIRVIARVLIQSDERET